jgi:hypothetical protein
LNISHSKTILPDGCFGIGLAVEEGIMVGDNDFVGLGVNVSVFVGVSVNVAVAGLAVASGYGVLVSVGDISLVLVKIPTTTNGVPGGIVSTN